MAAVVGNDGNLGPSLEQICDLYRSLVNDNFDGGVGQINTDAAPWMKPFLNAATRDLFSDLRMIGDLRVVRDNFLVLGLPPLAAADPTAQVALMYTGYYNGQTMSDQWLLPGDLIYLNRVWQRPSGTASAFHPLMEAPAGLGGHYQGQAMGAYEMRGNNELWMTGATLATDLRLRYTAVFPDIVGDNVDFVNTYVPIRDCLNAVAQKMVALYAQRLSPAQFPLAEQQAQKFTQKLISESVRYSQTKEFARQPFHPQSEGGFF